MVWATQGVGVGGYAEGVSPATFSRSPQHTCILTGSVLIGANPSHPCWSRARRHVPPLCQPSCPSAARHAEQRGVGVELSLCPAPRLTPAPPPRAKPNSYRDFLIQ